MFLVRFDFAAVLTSAVFNSNLFSKTSIDFATKFIFGSRELFFGRCSISFTFLTTGLIACFKARLVVLTVGISFIEFGISLSAIIVLTLLFHATLLHLVFVTVFILVVTLLELVLSFSL